MKEKANGVYVIVELTIENKKVETKTFSEKQPNSSARSIRRAQKLSKGGTLAVSVLFGTGTACLELGL